MRVVEDTDPATFLASAEPLLLADEPRHNLAHGILGTLIHRPGVYAEWKLWRVEDGGRTVGAALRTMPFPMILARPEVEGVLPALADHIAGSGHRLSGVMGAIPESDEFADLYRAAAGLEVGVREEQGIYAIERVEPVPDAPGSVRPATSEDADLVLDWYRAFHFEADPNMPWDDDRVRRRLAPTLAASDPDRGLFLWDDGGPVSLLGYGSPTPSGVRIGPVYTPPSLRGRGYATSLTADVSRSLLAGGWRFCFLYTDMANPTSNRIYRRIGYRFVCGSARLMFG